MVAENGRVAGSTAEFEEDWRKVLNTDDQRYYIYPARNNGGQIELFEWIKAQQVEALLHRSGVAQGRILEYGCGAAGISLYLAAKGYQAHVCDLSPNALRVAERNRTKHQPQVTFASAVAANAVELPYATGSFDVVMSYGLLEHFEPDPLQALLAEVVRVLRPGGLFIADIVPGPERLNARTFGLVANSLGAVAYHLAKGRWQQARETPGHYFEHYFESSDDDRMWAHLLRHNGLKDVHVDVCRPFPPLALSGKPERLYTNLIRRCLHLHQRFDRASNWFTRRWGWMYLASGRKAAQESW